MEAGKATNNNMLGVIKRDWELIKKTVKEKGELSDISYITWVKPLEVADLTGEELKISIPVVLNQAVTYISDHYKKIFEAVLHELYGQYFSVQFLSSSNKGGVC